MAYADKSIIAVSVYNPPYFITESGKDTGTEIVPPDLDAKKFSGYSWDILRESFHAMGYTIKLRAMP